MVIIALGQGLAIAGSYRKQERSSLDSLISASNVSTEDASHNGSVLAQVHAHYDAAGLTQLISLQPLQTTATPAAAAAAVSNVVHVYGTRHELERPTICGLPCTLLSLLQSLACLPPW